MSVVVQKDAAGERVEAELDRLVEKRAREARDAERVEETWAASVRLHHARQQETNRESGQLPRFVAPVGTEPPPELKSPPPPPRRQVGRRIILSGGGVHS